MYFMKIVDNNSRGFRAYIEYIKTYDFKKQECGILKALFNNVLNDLELKRQKKDWTFGYDVLDKNVNLTEWEDILSVIGHYGEYNYKRMNSITHAKGDLKLIANELILERMYVISNYFCEKQDEFIRKWETNSQMVL